MADELIPLSAAIKDLRTQLAEASTRGEHQFSEQLQSKPIHPEDVPRKGKPEYELRRVKRHPGRRHLANFENLPITTQVYELSAQERICPLLRGGAQRDWRGRELADRIHSRRL